MIKILINKFVPNYEHTEDATVRERYGIVAGSVGIFCNLCLFFLKLFAGLLSGAISVVADAFNNLSDAGSSIVTLLGFKLAGKPADHNHPFGHGRIEYLSGLLIAAVIILVGGELLRTSVEKIFHPEEISVSIIAIAILFASIFVKFWMFHFNKHIAKQIKSAAMEATAADSLNDCIATAGVLLGIAIYYFTGTNCDGYVGIGIALFILYSGVSTGKQTLQPLLGQAPESDFVNKIRVFVQKYPNIIGIHDLIVHDYGPGRRFVSLHAEIPSNMDMLKAHELIDGLEYDLHVLLSCEVIIHMDPVIVDDIKINNLRNQIKAIIKEYDPAFTMHDFRITNSRNGYNLIFDVVVPFQYKDTDEIVKERLSSAIKQLDPSYNAIICIDHLYI